jgi:amidophosphoribosyltransferase
MRIHKGEGLVKNVFNEEDIGRLPGDVGIGHVRYSTTGSSHAQNIQPLLVECIDGFWSMAHNGNLVNAPKIRHEYQEKGSIFQTSTDSEVMVHLIADPKHRNMDCRVKASLAELEGAFSVLMMNKNQLFCARDPQGFKPLSLGELGGGYVVSSETCAITQLGGKIIRDVEPGEVICIDKRGVSSSFLPNVTKEGYAHCVFELIYFARPDSYIFKSSAHKTRYFYGQRLAIESPVEADIVVAMPDSGNSATQGYSFESGLPLDSGFIRNHYVGRTFIMPGSKDRSDSVDMKLQVVPDVVNGKRVVVVDDSIVRGTTMKNRIQSLRDAGAKEIHVRISCPPICHGCYYGIDFPDKNELIAASRTVDEVCEYIQADSLAYLSIDSLLMPFGNPEDFCLACFNGKYPIATGDKDWKKTFERTY